jgi:hypothetical protein
MSTVTTNIINAMRADGNTHLIVTRSTAAQELAKPGYKADTPRPEGLD